MITFIRNIFRHIKLAFTITPIPPVRHRKITHVTAFPESMLSSKRYCEMTPEERKAITIKKVVMKVASRDSLH